MDQAKRSVIQNTVLGILPEKRKSGTEPPEIRQMKRGESKKLWTTQFSMIAMRTLTEQRCENEKRKNDQNSSVPEELLPTNKERPEKSF